MFHSNKWLQRVPLMNSLNEVHALPTDHWVMLEKHDYIINLLKKRLLLIAKK